MVVGTVHQTLHEPPWRAPGDTPAPTLGQRLGRALRRVVGALTLLFYFIHAPVGYAAFALLAVLPTRDPARRARRLQRIISVSFRGLHHWMRLTGMQRFDPRELAGEALPEGPCVLVANHPTLTDVTAIMASCGGVSTIIKASLFRRRWLRPLLDSAGQIEVVPGDPHTLDAVITAARRRLEAGSRVLIFPEGTRSPGGGAPGRFGRTAFELACRADVPVVPLVIRCDPVFLGKGGGLLRMPYRIPRMTLTVLPSVAPADHGGDSRAMKRAVEAVYRGQLADPAAPGAPAATDRPGTRGAPGNQALAAAARAPNCESSHIPVSPRGPTV